MTNTSLRLRKTPELYERILTPVFDIASKCDLSASVVGAAARDLIYEFGYDIRIKRATTDLDLAIAVKSWDAYEELKSELCEDGKFRRQPTVGHRLIECGGRELKIDLIPFGDIEKPPGQIGFPPDGDVVMSTIGLKEAYSSAINVEINESLVVKVASPAGIAMLKFMSFNDLPHTRQHDVQDIWFIATKYLDVGQTERLYDTESDLLDGDFDIRIAGARLLGRDIGGLLIDKTAAVITKLLENESNGGKVEKLADIIVKDEFYGEEKYFEFVATTFFALRTGIAESSKIPRSSR